MLWAAWALKVFISKTQQVVLHISVSKQDNYLFYIYFVVGAPFDVPTDLIFDAGHIPQGVLTSDFQFNAQDLGAFVGKCRFIIL